MFIDAFQCVVPGTKKKYINARICQHQRAFNGGFTFSDHGSRKIIIPDQRRKRLQVPGSPDRPTDHPGKLINRYVRIIGQIDQHLISDITSHYHGSANTRGIKQRILQPTSLVSTRTAHKIQRAADTGGQDDAGNSFFPNGF